MRITRIRIISQAFFFGLFVFFVLVTEFSHLKGWPVSLFLEVDPLVGFANAIAAHEVYKGLLWGVALFVPTLLLGRLFCNWICPFGTTHHFLGWLFGRREAARRIESNRYRRLYSVKYILLIVFLLGAAMGTLQIGLLDPICLLHRSFTVSVLPALDLAWPGLASESSERIYQFAWFVAFLFLFLTAMNAILPRFFCRSLCPLGAFLGALSGPALWRIHRDVKKCVDCDLCLRHCEGACDPHTHLRKAECFVCFNCIEDCPHDALSFRFLPDRRGEVAAPDLSGRRAVLAGIAGLALYPAMRAAGKSTKDYSAKIIRPPGSVEEGEFLRRCIKCEQCMKVCPTNVLQPTLLEAGLDGLWTPVMNMRAGYCDVNCVLCGQVCPTGAIQRITLEERQGIGEFQGKPVKVGTAFFDRGRCLPWAMDTPCVVCQEVCPTTPKAIYTREVKTINRYGQEVTLQQPYLDPAVCIGCGICEHECPVNDERAVRVSAVGETRSKARSLLLK
ncbi:MAG: 4Fe-4S binding protein [Candidatus Sumerlaeota bacterium]|nr:4Fe-4S binding protein [Candidatus Sumerlaeota bacterium]